MAGRRWSIREPNVGLHRLYAILTTEPNGVVRPIHDKAMPVLLMTAQDVDVWLNGTLEEALKLQKPRAAQRIVIASVTKSGRLGPVATRQGDVRFLFRTGREMTFGRPAGTAPPGQELFRDRSDCL
jgi:putative SOS response-associated peptidase YedK